MTELIDFLTSREIIMVYIVALIACALYFVIYLIDKHYYKLKRHQNTKELNKLVEDINDELAKENQEESISPDKEEDTSEVFHLEPVIKPSEDLNDLIIEPIDITENKEVVEEINKVEAKEVIKEFSSEEAENTNIEVNNQEVAKEELLTEEVLDYTTVEPDQTEAQAELKRLTEALEQASESTKNIDLTSYEEMQEKEAIISLEELLKKGKAMYENNEFSQYADEGNEPISLEDLEKKVLSSLEAGEEIELTPSYEQEEPVMTPIITMEQQETSEPEIINSAPKEKFVMDDFYTITSTEARKSQTAYKQYQQQPVISPIYGIEKTKSSADIELENTANYEKLDEEIKKTNEFLMTLKDLQKNLE